MRRFPDLLGTVLVPDPATALPRLLVSGRTHLSLRLLAVLAVGIGLPPLPTNEWFDILRDAMRQRQEQIASESNQ